MRSGAVGGCLAALGVLWGSSLAAQSPWERQVAHNLERVVRTLLDAKYRDTGERHGFVLNTDESASFPLTLHQDSAYVLVGVCDEDCTALQLQLFAATGYEVAAERSVTAVPILRITPRDTGSYRLTVSLAGCRVNPCWIEVAAFHR